MVAAQCVHMYSLFSSFLYLHVPDSGIRVLNSPREARRWPRCADITRYLEPPLILEDFAGGFSGFSLMWRIDGVEGRQQAIFGIPSDHSHAEITTSLFHPSLDSVGIHNEKARLLVIPKENSQR